MEELKIITTEKIELNNKDYPKYNFLNTKAIAILKLIEYLSKENKMLIDPLDIIKQEFLINYGNEKLDNSLLYKITISCLIDTCKYLENNLKLYIKDLYKNFIQRGAL